MNRPRLAILGHAVLIAVAFGAIVVVRTTATPTPASGTLPQTDTAPIVSQATPRLPAGPATMPRAAGPALQLAPPIIGGHATWYRASGMIGAAGPALRDYIGPHWRGSLVSVCASATGMCVVVRLTDWCLCSRGRRLVDLSDDAFAQLAPLSAGVIGVSITRVVVPAHLPATDASG